MEITEISKEEIWNSDKTVIDLFLEQCTSCGICRRECSFLESYGTPDEIIHENDRNVFLCTNCGRCSSVCPSGLLPSEALYSLKAHLIETGLASAKVVQALNSARKFIKWGSSAPFVHYPRTETVFWPGCSFAGMAPELIPAVGSLLKKQYGEDIGIALDCCGDPAYELGDVETTRQRTETIKQKLKEAGITTIIAGCANCVKVLRRFLPEQKVEHILEVLPVGTTLRFPDEKFYLHHPCPSYRYDSIQSGARRHCSRLGSNLLEQAGPLCCGQGGGLPALAGQRAEACADEVFHAAGANVVVTYCMGCKDQFLRKGKRSYHLLELIVGAQPKQKVFSSLRKWINRLRLSVTAKLLPGYRRQKIRSLR